MNRSFEIVVLMVVVAVAALYQRGAWPKTSPSESASPAISAATTVTRTSAEVSVPMVDGVALGDTEERVRDVLHPVTLNVEEEDDRVVWFVRSKGSQFPTVLYLQDKRVVAVAGRSLQIGDRRFEPSLPRTKIAELLGPPSEVVMREGTPDPPQSGGISYDRPSETLIYPELGLSVICSPSDTVSLYAVSSSKG